MWLPGFLSHYHILLLALNMNNDTIARFVCGAITTFVKSLVVDVQIVVLPMIPRKFTWQHLLHLLSFVISYVLSSSLPLAHVLSLSHTLSSGEGSEDDDIASGDDEAVDNGNDDGYYDATAPAGAYRHHQSSSTNRRHGRGVAPPPRARQQQPQQLLRRVDPPIGSASSAASGPPQQMVSQPPPVMPQRRNLENVRVVQRNLVYVVGLPSVIAREEVPLS